MYEGSVKFNKLAPLRWFTQGLGLTSYPKSGVSNSENKLHKLLCHCFNHRYIWQLHKRLLLGIELWTFWSKGMRLNHSPILLHILDGSSSTNLILGTKVQPNMAHWHKGQGLKIKVKNYHIFDGISRHLGYQVCLIGLYLDTKYEVCGWNHIQDIKPIIKFLYTFRGYLILTFDLHQRARSFIGTK